MTEVWNLENGNSKIIEPTLPRWYYAFGIGLYPVDPNFCQK